MRLYTFYRGALGAGWRGCPGGGLVTPRRPGSGLGRAPLGSWSLTLHLLMPLNWHFSSLDTDLTRNTRAPHFTQSRSTGFCAIWDCTSSSSQPPPLPATSQANPHTTHKDRSLCLNLKDTKFGIIISGVITSWHFWRRQLRPLPRPCPLWRACRPSHSTGLRP